jgi:glycosyltransferase involved in cell wall biosynthesis
VTGFAWTFGILLAVVWIRQAMDVLVGLPRLHDIARPEWDRTPDPAPRVSVIVPARDEEADIGACLTSLAAMDYPALEVVAVNDRSTDRTGEIMDQAAAASAGRIRVVHVAGLPPRWLGKTHAMWRAAQEASGDWLLFTDGDVSFRRDAVRRAMAYLRHSQADHLVVMPTALLRSPGERMMIGCLQVVSACAPGHRAWKTADPGSRDHVGVGACNLVRRTAYEAVGSFAALRLNVIEDLNLGRRIKEHGFSQHVVLGPGLLSLHWAKGAGGIVRTLSKNLFSFFGFRWWYALLGVLALFAVHIGPFAGAILAPGGSRIGYLLALAAMFAVYVRISRISGVFPGYFLTHPLGTMLLGYAVLRSAVKVLWQGGVTWRGTHYPLSDLRGSR